MSHSRTPAQSTRSTQNRPRGTQVTSSATQPAADSVAANLANLNLRLPRNYEAKRYYVVTKGRRTGIFLTWYVRSIRESIHLS